MPTPVDAGLLTGRRRRGPARTAAAGGRAGRAAPAQGPILRTGRHPSPDFREVHRADWRGAEEFYRERWRQDKVVRARRDDPVAAWAEITGDPGTADRRWRKIGAPY